MVQGLTTLHHRRTIQVRQQGRTTMTDVIRELKLDALKKPASDWTDDEWQAMAALVLLICEHLDLDIKTLTGQEIVTEVAEAMDEGRMPQAFFDDLFEAADQRRGGRLQ
jgi:hypothetical protein